MKRSLLLSAVGLIIAGAIAANSWAERDDDDRDGGEPTTRSACGATCPTPTLQATIGVPNLIADMNSQDLAFTVHDGDLKAGTAPPARTRPLQRRAVRSGARLSSTR